MKPAYILPKSIFLFLGVLLAGCSLLPATGGVQPPPPVPPISGGGQEIRALAEVESVEVQTLGPTHVNVVARGNLPDACTTLADPTQLYTGKIFYIAIVSVQPGDAVCAQVLTPFEVVTPLEMFGLPAGEYIVDVNGVQARFNLESPPGSDVPPARLSGVVWHDLCAVGGGEGGAPLTPTAGCILTTNGSYRANGVLEAGEPGLGNVQVYLGEGACPSNNIGGASTDLNGMYAFSNLQPGTYCVSIDPLTSQNTSVMVPGHWSFPAEVVGEAIAYQTIELAAGEDKQNLNFGWDFQNLPAPPQVATPTLAPTLTPTSVPPPCDWAQFVADITVPDNTPFTPSASFVKTWRLKNIGSCTWTTNYSLVFASGSAMTTQTNLALPHGVAPGQTVDLSVKMTAPVAAGNYKGFWILRNPAGKNFGLGAKQDGTFWVAINVIAPNSKFKYDFAANYCSASWSSAAGTLACPGSTSSTKGFVTYLANPVLETRKENEPALWVRPNHGEGGWISGVYQGVPIQKGDRFKAWVGCMGDNQGCDITFSLAYLVNGGSLQTLGVWHEIYDGLAAPIDLDLSALAGQTVEFRLFTKINNKNYEHADGFWFVPRIVNELPANDNPAVENARAIVAAGLGTTINDLKVVSVEGPLNWTDTCLGVFLPDQFCAEAITPGYRIKFSWNSRVYEAHTNLDGSIVYWFELG